MVREDLFWAKVEVTGACWLWTAARDGDGYGNFWNGVTSVGAHRWAWEFLVGPIPSGLDIDHLCRVHACVNPDHLEPVTRRKNVRRGFSAVASNAHRARCVNGHEFAVERHGGRRVCHACQRAATARYRAKRAALA